MARFEKGAERPMNAGRKLGSVNKTTPSLRTPSCWPAASLAIALSSER
jgi:hypothetical protein